MCHRHQRIRIAVQLLLRLLDYAVEERDRLRHNASEQATRIHRLASKHVDRVA
jgi:hypothetical protein